MPRTALASLYLLVLLALIGFGTFGLHPGLIAGVPGAASAYSVIYRYVGQVQVWSTFLVLALVLLLRVGWRWLPAFGAIYLISFASEFIGTSWGIPFGGYAYSQLLGPKWLNQVPIVIPLSWFCMAVPSYFLAGVLLRDEGRIGSIVLGSLFLVAWDLALDPAMSFLTPYWVWSDTGPYYGMPWLNPVGWFLTGLALMGVLRALRSERWITRLGGPWLLAFYGVSLLMPLGMLTAAGEWVAVLTAFAAHLALIGGALSLPRTARRTLLPAGAGS